MSVRILSRVWEHSSHTGTELLMLLAIADFADDDGNAYPAVPTLATKCRMSARNANFLLTALRASGELEVRANEGPKGTNRYRVMSGRSGAPLKPASPLEGPRPLKPTSGSKGAQPLKPTSPPDPEACFTPEAGFTLKPMARTPEAGFLQPLKPTSDEPSLNRQEPYLSGFALVGSADQAENTKLPNCPTSDLIAAYHEVLPELPRVRLVTKDRERSIPAFWRWVLTSKKSDGSRRATSADEAIAWIRSYFGRARSNGFLMGQTARAAGHEGWRCDLDYLLSDRGRKQVLERTEVIAA